MKSNMWLVIIAALVAFEPASGWAQRGSARDSGRSSRGGSRGSSGATVNFNYNDISERKTKSDEREERKKKEAEAAKKKAEEEKRQKERRERYEKYEKEKKEREDAKKDDKDDNKSAAAAKAASPAAQAAAKAKNFAALRKQVQASGKAPAAGAEAQSVDPTTRQVTEVMLDAVQTQSVNFNPAEARANPGVILLNSPKFDPAERKRAGDYGIGSPL